ncbi:Spc97/Spc98 family protein [Hypomontagnella submonticulosa]|nr:Spc97/Spc98 family protein [Hypomontagnella submonticulosa]
MADEDPADVFAFPDFDQSSKWLTLSQGSNSEFFNSINLVDSKPIEGHITVKPAKADVDGFFRLPNFSDTTDVDGLGTTHQDASTTKPLHDVNLHDLDLFDDSWLQTHEPEKPEAEYKTWDAFLTPDASQVAPLFITEAGPGAYDAAISPTEDLLRVGNTKNNIIQANPYLSALLALVFGRGSTFFVWDEGKASFTPDLDEMRISGYSSKVLQGLQRHCIECGNTTRFLSAYVQTTYKTHPGAVRVAVAKAADVILLTIQKILGARARDVRSLLQLQSLAQPIHSILAHFRHLIAKISRLKTDEQVLSYVFEEAQVLEHSNALLSEIMREVLSRVSEPWTQFAEKWIGVKVEEGILITKENPGNGFVKVENIAIVNDSGLETEELDYVLDEDRMPGFVPSEVALVMFETGKTLRLLRTHHPEHPLCRPETILRSMPPPLRWHFDWESIGHFREDVEKYERHLFQDLQGWPAGTSAIPRPASLTEKILDAGYALEFFGHEEGQIERQLLASIAALDKPPTTTSEEDNLSKLLNARLLEENPGAIQPTSSFSPHWSLIPYHSFGPLVAAQARVVNREYIKLLFSAHQLRDHLSMQKQFQLLGNGVFCSRLSHALFDPNLGTAERQTGVALTGGAMGLRLSGRDNWPPASSELRLALMGVLVESYLPSSFGPEYSAEKRQNLPGDISFAVRDLTSEEIDRCLDPGSLEALDFLRLLYKPPAPLSPIFTPLVMLKYDKVFKLLLRVLRMLYVTEQLFQDTLGRTSGWRNIDNASLRFRFEAQHFVASISAYFFDTGIETPWRQFQSWLEGVENGLTKSERDPQEVRILSPDELREEHERMLDRIMHTLLLRKRQQPVMKLLEDIFVLILKFSKAARLEALGSMEDQVQASSYKSLYETFKKKVDVFITVCRGLKEKDGQAWKPSRNDVTTDDGRRGEGVKGENTIDRLLIKLEMSGYYGHSRA